MNKKYSAFFVVLLIIWLSPWNFFSSDEQSPTVATETAFDISSLHMQRENGETVTPFDTTDDRVRILYFGYIKCPEVCPTSLAVLSGALAQLEPEVRSKLRPIFISLDPERDLPEASFQYAEYFDPMLEGVSFSLWETKQLADHFGVIYQKVEMKDSQLNYAIDHSAYFYLTNPDGSLIQSIPHIITPRPLVEAIRSIVQ